jgi:hypothetical protein
MRPFQNASVAKVFDAYPANFRRKLLALREKIFRVADSIDGVGQLEETLKWGEPAYVTVETKSGSTIRIHWKKSNPTQYAMYFICTTGLVETFRTLFPDDFKYEGNRAILFAEKDEIPDDALTFCIGTALTYQRDKRAKGRAGSMRTRRLGKRSREATELEKPA